MTTTYSKQKVVERMTVVSDRLGVLQSLKSLSNTQEAERDKLYMELVGEGGLQDRLKQCEAEERATLAAAQRNDALERVRAAAQDPDALVDGGGGRPGDPSGFKRDDSPAGQLREKARRTIDQAHRSGSLAEHAAEAAERLVTTGTAHERGVAAEWVTVTGTPEYFSAFTKLANDPQRGHLMWDDAERDAFTAGARVQALLAGKRLGIGERAMSLTDAAGGYLVPFQLDPSIILTDDGVASSIASVARTVTATGDVWHGVSSAGVTNSWDDEAEEVSDDSPTLAQPSVPIHMNRTFVPISIEALMDEQNVAQEVARLIADEARTAEATALTLGTGTGEPTGIITALAGGSSVVTPTTGETFAAADVYKVQNALPPRFQNRATWHANLAIINTIAQFETSNGALKFPEVGDGRLLRRALHENSVMDGTIDPAATAANHVLLYGDFAHYVVARRIGLTVEFVAHLFGENGRPTGQRGWFAYFRLGADAVVDNAFRLLNVATTA